MTGRPKGGGLEGVVNPHEIRWFRQKGESRKAYEAFAIYRDLGAARTLAKVATHLGKSIDLIKCWSARWEWVDRAASFDANEEWERMVSMREQRTQMFMNDAKIARMVKQKVVDRLATLDANELSPTQLAHWFEVAVKVERLSLGESTENFDRVIRQGGEDDAALLDAIEEDPDLANAAAKIISARRRAQRGGGGYDPGGAGKS